MTSQPAPTKPKLLERPLIRCLAINGALGAVCSWLFVGALIGFDVCGLRSLLIAADALLLGTIMLVAVMTITWGSASMGTAVFLLPKGRGGGGSRRPVGLVRRPALVEARIPARRR